VCVDEPGAYKHVHARELEHAHRVSVCISMTCMIS
jgi:hypothetical protein